MSEEEERAINNIKSLLLYSKEHEYFSPFQEQEIDDMNIVLNLLEKRQKEIEELKSIASEFTNRNIEQFSIGEFNFKVKHFKNNYISKDKVREAIKNRELEIYADNEEICNAEGFYNIAFLYDKTIDVLKELLEEE